MYLGGIGMGGAQRLRGPGDRMQPSLVIHVEACHIGRLRSPVGGIQDIEQASLVAQADRTSPTRGKDPCQRGAPREH